MSKFCSNASDGWLKIAIWIVPNFSIAPNKMNLMEINSPILDLIILDNNLNNSLSLLRFQFLRII